MTQDLVGNYQINMKLNMILRLFRKVLHKLTFGGNFLLNDYFLQSSTFRSSPSEVFLGKGVLKVCSKGTGEHLRQTAISIKLQSNFIKMKLRYGSSPVNLLHIFSTHFPDNTSKGLFLNSL